MLHSYELNGVADSFSDFISNISPEDTIIVSDSRKEKAKSSKFSWQYDALDKVVYDSSKDFAIEEGAEAPATEMINVKATSPVYNNTQIFRKVFSISDSALSTSVHGRKGELQLQLKKAGKELKNVMEIVFSSKQDSVSAADGVAPKTKALFMQIAAKDLDNPDLPAPTKAGENAVHKAGKINFDSFDSICIALYRAGSKANVIVANPVNAGAINTAIDEGATKKVKQLVIFDETQIDPVTKRHTQLDTFTDSLGRIWVIKYSRFAPTDVVYFLNKEDLTQCVLREPVATKLGKDGSFETWQLIIEAGLRVSNPFAIGCLEVTATP